MIQKIKLIINFIIYSFIDFIVSPSIEIKQNSLLLIRLDAIGDYVMFRNFIEILKKSNQYKDYKFTLIGNSNWKSLALELDGQYIDQWIWIDRDNFSKDFLYRYEKLKEITSSGYEVVLNPVYSREFFIVDNIVKLVTSKEKIGSISDLSNMKKLQKKISDKYYTDLIEAKNNLMFEFNRNKEFFENLLHRQLSILKPKIDLSFRELDFKLPKQYAILFIGARDRFRKWDIEKFAQIGEYLNNNYDYEIVLCGSLSDKEDALRFSQCFKYDYINLVGKTSLVELLYVIDKGSFMISNETSAPHFAVALEMSNIFVISNGNHYGRFTPYPKDISENYHVIYHPELEKDLDDYKKISNSYNYKSYLDIQDITIECVIQKLKKFL